MQQAQWLTGALDHAIEAWLHEFRAAHGEPYVFALVTDDAAIAIRPAANTLAHLRTAGSDERWNRAAWLDLPSGPEFERTSASLKVDAWQPDFTRFREQVFTGMLFAMTTAAKRRVFGKRNTRDAMTLFATIQDSTHAPIFERRSATLLNSRAAAAAFLAARS